MFSDRPHRPGVAYATVAAIYALAVAIAQLPLWTRDPEVIAAGILFDLTMTSIVVLWVLGRLARDQLVQVSIGLIAAGLTLTSVMFPNNALTASAGYQVALVVSRTAVAAVAIWSISRVVRRRRALILSGASMHDATVRALQDILHLGRAAPMVASEAMVLSLALTGWRQKTPTGPQYFTLYKESGVLAYSIGIGCLVVVESIALHLIVATYSVTAAWVLTATSMYTFVWLLADAQAFRLEPVALRAERLDISVGVRWRASVPLAIIAKVDREPTAPGFAHRNVTAPAEQTVCLELTEPLKLKGPFGITRCVQSIGLSIDEPDAFIKALQR